jgi:Methionine biosynthesis protein MetW
VTDESQIATADDVVADDRAYLEQVRREIDEEVRRRRAAGDFPPSFERKLDELFARFTPTGTHDDHFTDALKLADRAAYFDTQVPFGSRRKPQGFTKWMLWQAEAWFVNYVVRQLNHFSSSVMRVVHLLDERVSEVEAVAAMSGAAAFAEEDIPAPGADTAPFTDALLARLTSASSPKGRVLHAECGDGALLEKLSTNLDVYGIDPGTAASDEAVKKGLDVRRDDILGHLASVGDEKLSGLVLSGSVDRMSLLERRRLLTLAELKLAQGGTVGVVISSTQSWERSVGPVVSDLSPGGPWHPETWAYLLSNLGFTDVATFAGPTSGSFERADAGDHAAAAVNKALDRLEALVVGPDSYCVVATKRRVPSSTKRSIDAGGQ